MVFQDKGTVNRDRKPHTPTSNHKLNIRIAAAPSRASGECGGISVPSAVI